MNFFRQLIRTLSHPSSDEIVPTVTKSSTDTTTTSKLIRTVGREGNAIGHFCCPGGIAVTEQGDAVIADTGNNRIQIISRDGQILTCFGSPGPDSMNINCPADVAISPEGYIFVTDPEQACVKAFSSQGEFMDCIPGSNRTVFSSKLSNNVTFQRPHGLAVTQNGYIIISDIMSHMITILTPSGELRNRFGGGPGSDANQLDHPYFIAVTRDRRVVVSDWGNVSVKVFTFGGVPVHKFTSSDFRLKQSPAFDSLASVPEMTIGSGVTWQLGGICLDSEENVLLIVNDKVCLLEIGRSDDMVCETKTYDGHLCQVFTDLISPVSLAYASDNRLVLTEGISPCRLYSDPCNNDEIDNNLINKHLSSKSHVVMYRFSPSYYKTFQELSTHLHSDCHGGSRRNSYMP